MPNEDQLTKTLLDLLPRAPLSIGHEKRAQAELEQHLTDAGLAFQREARLSQRDVVDFLIGEDDVARVVIELKIRAQRKRIYKQLERYAEHTDVCAIILLTATPMSLPETIGGKPAYCISLGQAWL